MSTIQFIQDDTDIKIEPDKERPTIPTKLKKLIRRLTGTQNEDRQILYLKELIIEEDKLIFENENIVEKYLS